MDFIFVSLQRINTNRDSTSTCLAKELAKKHRVLYVNAPIDRRVYYAKDNDKYTLEHIKSVKSKVRSLVKNENNLWVLNPGRILESINWIPYTPLFSFLNRFNNKRLGKDIKEAADELGFKDYIFINDKDIFRSFYLKEILKPKKYIYLDRDYTVGMGYWRRHGVSLEPKLMEKSDAVVCNSHDFTKRARQYNPNSYYIGNGFDASQYDPTKRYREPDDLKDIPGPRIGYIGALITLRLDLKLMIELAKAKPSWSFVLIGWEDDDFANSELHRLSNVHYLGSKHTKEVPAYIQHLDVCLNPQILNDITRGNFPLKVVEYLALGRPVVATATNTMNEIFSNHTYLSEATKDGYIRQIEKALAEDSPEKQEERIAFANHFSWENVTNLLLESIGKTSVSPFQEAQTI